MARNTLNTAVELYQNGTFTLDQASAQSECSAAKLAAELQARDIPLREADRDVFRRAR